jgi:hypothetical protein
VYVTPTLPRTRKVAARWQSPRCSGLQQWPVVRLSLGALPGCGGNAGAPSLLAPAPVVALSPAEMAIVKSVLARLLPADELGPGAVEAGVPPISTLPLSCAGEYLSPNADFYRLWDGSAKTNIDSLPYEQSFGFHNSINGTAGPGNFFDSFGEGAATCNIAVSYETNVVMFLAKTTTKGIDVEALTKNQMNRSRRPAARARSHPARHRRRDDSELRPGLRQQGRSAVSRRRPRDHERNGSPGH